MNTEMTQTMADIIKGECVTLNAAEFRAARRACIEARYINNCDVPTPAGIAARDAAIEDGIVED
jgi:hypothetical protein